MSLLSMLAELFKPKGSIPSAPIELEEAQADGPGVDADATLPLPSPLLANQPLGIRNNNPGNIRVGPDRWQGAAGENKGFIVFRTPVLGIRALCVVLMTYQRKYGHNTVRSIIGRWAPPVENDTAAYVRAVAQDMNVGPDELLNMRDMHDLCSMVDAIIQHENGRNPYSDAQIRDGAQLALGA